jgi:hypothetical protein
VQKPRLLASILHAIAPVGVVPDLVAGVTVAVKVVGLPIDPEDGFGVTAVTVLLQTYSGSELDPDGYIGIGNESLKSKVPHGTEASCKWPAIPHRSIPGALVASPLYQFSPTLLNMKAVGSDHVPFTRKLFITGMVIKLVMPTFPPHAVKVSRPRLAPPFA